jgi:hypothetical protein
MALRPELDEVVRALLARHAESVTLDAIGEAIGARAVSTEDVEAILTALETAGRAVVGPEGARGAETLRRVVPAARELAQSLGRKPTIEEIAAHIGLSAEQVRHALALGSVMGR